MHSGTLDLPIGHRLHKRYIIRRRVGGGGMGTVYKASDERLIRTVAIKELKPDTVNGIPLADAKDLFYQEMKILSSLRHAHLPRVYDWFEEGDRYYLVMQFIEGETLLKHIQRMRGHPLPIDLILHYAVQLCDVLIYLHDGQHSPVIFRDLKPSNIMITPKGEVYLIDFGIARLFKTGKSSDTRAFGTLGYTAPEVGFLQTDARADIYSLGVTLHYCLTLLEPEKKFHAQFSSILPYNKEVSPTLNNLILRMVERSPGNRPASMKQVKRALEDIRRQVGTVAAPMSNATTIRTAHKPSANSSSPRTTPAMPMWSKYGNFGPYPASQPNRFQLYNAPTEESVHAKLASGFGPSQDRATGPEQSSSTQLQKAPTEEFVYAKSTTRFSPSQDTAMGLAQSSGTQRQIAQSAIVPILIPLLSTVVHFFTLVLLPPFEKLGQAIQCGLAICLPPALRRELSGLYGTSRRYLLLLYQLSGTHFLALRRKFTGVWTLHFLLLLGVCLIGSILVSLLLYRTLGGSYYRVELGLAFILLLSLIVVHGFMHHPVPRNILICTGVFVTLDILMLAIQQITEDTQQQMTFSTFLTYGIAMLALVALIGKVATRETAPSSHVVRPTSWFIRLSHVALAAIAGICFSLQYLLGQQEQIPLVAVMEPLASPIVGTFTLNDILLCLPAGILLLSLWRFKRPFEAVDRVLLALLGILWIPLQYTFGQAELTHVPMFAQTSAASITPFNLFLITAPLAAAGIALSWARAGLEWLDQMALLTLAVVSGWLQNFQQGLFFPAQNSEGLYLATLGQLLGLSIERIAMTSLLAAVLISFFWLTRSTVSVDRIVLGLTFGVATLFILMQYMHIQHMLLLVALILLLQGVIVATRIERVHHSNRL